jgi:DNA-binding NarL/FixJ family response regulator
LTDPEPIRLLIVEDEKLFREMLRRILDAEPEVTVIGVAETGEEAVTQAESLQPDVVMMDVELPGEMDGIDAALVIKAARPETGIVILSAHKERRYLMSVPIEDSAGWAYLLKQSVPDMSTVIRAIQGTMMGMMVLDPAVVSGLSPRRNTSISRLTPRQLDVLELIAQGFNNAAVAGALTLTEKSVETYINAIYQELGLSGEPGQHARVMSTLRFLDESVTS